MAELRPAAQAVLDAVKEISPAPADEIAAVALRAATDQPYHVPSQLKGDAYWAYRYGVDAERERLLAIATELES